MPTSHVRSLYPDPRQIVLPTRTEQRRGEGTSQKSPEGLGDLYTAADSETSAASSTTTSAPTPIRIRRNCPKCARNVRYNPRSGYYSHHIPGTTKPCTYTGW